MKKVYRNLLGAILTVSLMCGSAFALLYLLLNGSDRIRIGRLAEPINAGEIIVGIIFLIAAMTILASIAIPSIFRKASWYTKTIRFISKKFS